MKLAIKILLYVFVIPGIIQAHEGHISNPARPTAVTLGLNDIKFVMENPTLKLAYIPEIVKEVFILLKDLDSNQSENQSLQEFMSVIARDGHLVSHAIALKAIFAALNVIKKQEEILPKSYMNQIIDILFGYQKALHKEEFVFHGLDTFNTYPTLRSPR